MPKRLILILLFLSPLLNIILISTAVECSLSEAFAQVVIKDEIVLVETEAEIDAATLTMPFYGRVYSQIPCQWNHWTSGAIKITRMAGGQTKLDGCSPSFVCGSGWCACSVGTRAHNFYNVPQGAEIFVEIQRCFNPPPNPPNEYDWYDVPLQFTFVGNNRYDLYGQDLYDQSWDYIGYFRFYPTTPPGCNYANECSTGYTVTMPDTLSVKQPFSFTSEDECSTYIDYQGNPVIPLAKFNGILNSARKASNILNLNSENHINVCFDSHTQELKFELLIDNTTLNYAKDICLDNITDSINATPIFALSDICQVSVTECTKLKNSLEAHKSYPFGSGIYNGYVFTEILLTHETEHQKDWEGYIRQHIHKYFNIPNKISYSCDNFTSIQQAKEKILGDIKQYFVDDFWNPYREAWLRGQYRAPLNEAMQRQLEIDLHKRESVKLIIQKYEDEIDKLCKGKCI